MRAVAKLLFIFVALAGPAHASEALLEDRFREGTCTSPEGWEALEKRDPDFVVFGETHGTREAPAFFGSLACSLARKGERLLVAIEFSSQHDAALQIAWNADETEFEKLALEAGWLGRRDGVGSEAMFAMVRDLHRLQQAGYVIDITAFNGARSDDQRARFADLPGQGPHEAAQAENIAIAARGGSYDRVLVLVGNLHAEKQPITLGDLTFDPMAMRLAEYGSVLSLDMRYGAGTSWNCQLRKDFDLKRGAQPGDIDIECASHQTKGNWSINHEPFIGLNEMTGDAIAASFDGYFWVGPVTASPPQAPM